MGTRPIVYKYPLDLTGNNPNNLVLGESHTLPTGTNRAVVPNYGAFYSQSLVVREKSSGAILRPREQFKAVQLYQEATTRTGLEVCAALIITDTAVGNEVEIDYQVVGGEFSYSVTGLRRMIETLDLDARPVRWGDLLGKPGEFPPAPHLHDAGDVYGFEYLVEAIESLRHAILVGNEGSLSELRDYIIHVEEEVVAVNERCTLIEQRLAMIEEFLGFSPDALELKRHLDRNNPHGVTKQQVGLGAVANTDFARVVDVSGAADLFLTTLG